MDHNAHNGRDEGGVGLGGKYRICPAPLARSIVERAYVVAGAANS